MSPTTNTPVTRRKSLRELVAQGVGARGWSRLAKVIGFVADMTALVGGIAALVHLVFG